MAKRSLAIPKASLNWDVGPDYQIMKQLGEGSSGLVCEARHLPSGDRVAIKRVSNLFNDLVDSRRILREISILRYLDHPNIVKIREIVHPSDLNTFNELYLVMDHAQSDLRKLLKSSIHLNHDHIQMIIYNLLAGLSYIHSAHILHRDLKPANILINEDCEVKICDFGLARAVSEEVKDETPELEEEPLSAKPFIEKKTNGKPGFQRSKSGIQTKKELTGHVVTRWYRAPELILLEKSYTKAIDIWSLGCIIAELCGMLKENAPTFMDRSPLFPGNSCFPLSPDQYTKVRRAGFPSSNSDQLNVIFEIIGTPNEEDLKDVTDERAIAYIKSFEEREPKSFDLIYPSSDKQLVRLMEKMIVFNRNKRLTCDQALADEYFDSIRDSSKETKAEIPADFEFEYMSEIDLPSMRGLFLQEFLKYK